MGRENGGPSLGKLLRAQDPVVVLFSCFYYYKRDGSLLGDPSDHSFGDPIDETFGDLLEGKGFVKPQHWLEAL
jgi:hypothetical protein